ncbi:hypothetical protein [Burkholderia cenocepacia]|uniref:hypothetical protein n=1 Tax=Burkholderia cenocepacia TaxID=95486 RepID=UPI0022304DFB|nr:hypothetical protein [Burkholderia cenocepacia]MCW3543079.1 hypothetical protein [Burkholderia cenocepacia]
MDTTKTGGPAFPLADAQSVHRIGAAAIEGITDSAERDRAYIEATARACAGMTLRDYFAAKAMESLALLQDLYAVDTVQGIEAVAANAYDLADAMIRARGEA